MLLNKNPKNKMSDTFLHGVETITSPQIALVNTVKTAVIGLIGTAATGDTDKLILCATEKDDTQFGLLGTIPEALAIIRSITKKTGATVLVVSVGTGTPTPVAADFTGSVTDGVRTGLKCFETAFSQFGFNAKVFIAPRFTGLSGVAAALTTSANQFRGCAYLDAPTGTTVSGAIALRITAGLWASTSTRAMLYYPGLKNSTGTVVPLSTYAAAIRAKVDATSETAGGGFWVSSSNNTIDGITGLETELTAAINDPTTETNLLNASGITTVFNNYGADFRLWGNRNSSFPTETGALTFECGQRTKDIVDESIELAMLPYIDKPIIQAYIDLVRQTVNNYFNGLIARKALLEGSQCTYDPAKNSTEELANGHVVFTTVYMFPTPGERITFDNYIDTSLLSNLK